MKLTALLLLALLPAFSALSQRTLSGTSSISSGSSCVDKVRYSISYSYTKSDESDGEFTVDCNLSYNYTYSDAGFTYGGRTYYPSDLGYNQWPTEFKQGFWINLAFYHGNTLLFTRKLADYNRTVRIGRQVVEGTYSFQTNSTVNKKTYFNIQGAGKIENFSMANCRVEVQSIEGGGCSGFETIKERLRARVQVVVLVTTQGLPHQEVTIVQVLRQLHLEQDHHHHPEITHHPAVAIRSKNL